MGRATVKLRGCAGVVCSGGITNSSQVLLTQFVNMARFEWYVGRFGAGVLCVMIKWERIFVNAGLFSDGGRVLVQIV